MIADARVVCPGRDETPAEQAGLLAGGRRGLDDNEKLVRGSDVAARQQADLVAPVSPRALIAVSRAAWTDSVPTRLCPPFRIRYIPVSPVPTLPSPTRPVAPIGKSTQSRTSHITGRFRDRRRLDAEMRCQGATGAAEDRHPEGGDADPRAHSGT